MSTDTDRRGRKRGRRREREEPTDDGVTVPVPPWLLAVFVVPMAVLVIWALLQN